MSDTHGHDHPPHLAHHFDTPQQQFESGKLGMWIFLATEVLMFGGLFCAYSIYRAFNLDIFLYGHQYLDTNLGAVNTVVLLASSFTMAMAVRCAQLGQQKRLLLMIALTFLGACGFLMVKRVEYGSKFDHHLWPGRANLFYPIERNTSFSDPEEQKAEILHLEAYYGIGQHAEPERDESDSEPAVLLSGGGVTTEALLNSAGRLPHRVYPGYFDLPVPEQKRVHLFFQIYYCMTGLHVIHVLIGMGLMIWLFTKAVRGIFGPQYYTPVDVVGLYWHLVDLIWIFLFPLLYLIH